MLSLTLALAPSLVLSFSTGTAPRGSAVIAAQPHANAVTMAAKKQIAIGIVGPGLVGGELMAQIEATKPLLDKQGLEVTVAAISELKPDASGKLQGWQICSDKSLSIADFKAALADPDAGEPGDFDKMADFLKSTAPHAVMFDTTASEIVSNMYPKWLAKGVHVVTPNKKVGSGDLPRFLDLPILVATLTWNSNVGLIFRAVLLTTTSKTERPT